MCGCDRGGNLAVGLEDSLAIDELIIMLIGASLSARSGSRTISLEHEQSIDKMIEIAEEATRAGPGK